MRFLKLCFFILLFTLLGCSSSQPRTSSSKTFDNTEYNLEPLFRVYHDAQSTSKVYFQINSKELLYTRQFGSTDFSSRVNIYWELTSDKITDILDSAVITMVDINNTNEQKILRGDFQIKAPFGKITYLAIKVRDLNKNVTHSETITIDKATKFGSQFFLPKYKTGEIFFKEYVSSKDTLVLFCKSTGKLFVNHYKREFSLAPPPFATNTSKPFDYKPDSSFIIEEDKEHKFLVPELKKGFFHFRADTSSKTGFTVFKFSESFPEVTTAEQLIKPLRYITSKDEFEQLNTNTNKKAAVDNFWLEVGRNKDRAKGLIRKYYTRVENANKNFTSYVEGWKTDRGMIHIIYGPPASIFKNAYSETWTYHEERSFNSFTFTFVKVLNPFTNNDFMLDRSGIYKNSWYNALDYWRQGKINFDY